MRRSTSARLPRALTLLVAAAALSNASSALAADGTWTSTTSGNWTDPLMWSGGTIADGSNFTGFFNTLDLTADLTVTLNGNRTIGNLTFADTNTTTAAGWIITGNTLTLAGTTPTITVGTLGTGKLVTINSILTGTSGLVKEGAGQLTISNGGNGGLTGNITVNSGLLIFNTTVDYSEAFGKSGTVTVNAGAELRITGAKNPFTRNATDGAVLLNGGIFDYQGATHGHMGNITLSNGATWKASAGGGYSGENMQLNGDVTVSNTGGNTTASTMSNFSQGLGLNGIRTFNVANVTGSAAADLIVSMELEDRDSGTNGILKTGDGTMRFTTGQSYTGTTTVSGGTLLFDSGSTLRSSSGITVNSGATLELGATNIFTDGHGTAVNNSRVITVDSGTLLMNSNMDSRFGNVTLKNGATWTSNRSLSNYDALLGNTVSGTVSMAATVSVVNTGGNTSASTMNGTGGIHLQGVQNFDVADVTGSAATDLTVSMILGAQGSAAGTAGGINKLGAGTMELRAANTYTGATTITAGKLIISRSTAANDFMASSGYDIASGSTLELNYTGASGSRLSNVNNTVSGAGSFVKSGSGFVWLGNGGGSLYTTFDMSAGALIDIQGGTLDTLKTSASNKANLTIASGATLSGPSSALYFNALNGSGSLALGGQALTLGVDNGGGTFSGVISGSGSLTKNGTGTLALSGTNTYSGNTTVSAGILDLTGGGGSSGTIRGTVNVTGGGQLRLSAVDVTGYATDSSRLSVINLNGATDLSGTGTLHVATGTGVNQTLGNATINMTGASITGAAGSNLDFYQGSSALNSLASGTTSTVSGVKLSIRQGVGLTVTVADGAAATDMRIASQIVASTNESNAYTAAPLIKDGAGLLELTGTNTYTGLTRVKAGALVIGSAGSLASGNALTIDSTGTAEFQNVGQTLGAVSNANTAANALNFSASTGTVTLASLTGSGNTRFGSNATVTGGIASGTVTTVGALNANISGTAAVTAGGLLTGTLSGGTVGAGSLSSSSVTGGTNAITGAASITTLNGGTTTVGGVATIGTMTSGTANLNGATSAITTLNGGTVNLDTATALTVNEGTFGGSITGGSLTKAGNGTLTLSGTSNTFNGLTVNAGKFIVGTANALGTGTVTVAGGELDLSSITTNKAITVTGGTVSGSSEYTGALTFGGSSAAGLNGTFRGTVDLGTNPNRNYTTTGLTVAANGGVLQGQGKITGDVTVNGHLNIGNSPGALEVTGNVVLGSGSTSTFEIEGETAGAFDVLSLSGTLTLDGTITVASYGSFNANTLTAGDSFDFIVGNIDATGFDVANDLKFGTNMTLASGLQWDTSQFASQGILSVTTAIPEPSTYGLAGAGILALATAIRRRRRAAR